MSIHLITGYAGKEHITSADSGAFQAGIVGAGKYVLNTGNKFSCEVVNNNLIKVRDGDLINQGRHISIATNDYEECIIENGLQSVKRNDLIVARYRKNTETAIETAQIVVIKGISSANPVDPAYITGNILAGDETDDFPLYRVRLNGLSIGAVEPMFEVMKPAKEIWDKMGKADISKIGDGTVTGAIEAQGVELGRLNTNLTKLTPSSEHVFDVIMSAKTVYQGTAYVSTSIYVPNGFTLTISNVDAVGASGNFIGHINTQRWGSYYRFTTTNANLAGLMLQITGTIK